MSASHPLIRHFVLGAMHANSAPPSMRTEDLQLPEPEVCTLDEVEAQMEAAGQSCEFWYNLGRMADGGDTLLDDEGRPYLCYAYLTEEFY